MGSKMSTHGEIEQELRKAMTGVGELLDRVFNDDAPEKKIGFALLVFEFGCEGRMNYLSNAKREDMIAAMKEWIARAEGRHIEETQTPPPEVPQ